MGSMTFVSGIDILQDHLILDGRRLMSAQHTLEVLINEVMFVVQHLDSIIATPTILN